jgi:hypothetical protein
MNNTELQESFVDGVYQVSAQSDDMNFKPAPSTGTGSFAALQFCEDLTCIYLASLEQLVRNRFGLIEVTIEPLYSDRLNDFLGESEPRNSQEFLINEAIAKIWIKIAEEVLHKAQAHDLLTQLQGDTSLTKSIELLASISYESINVALTEDPSVFFSVELANGKSIYFENYLEQDNEQPSIVFLVYHGSDCVSNGFGTINQVSNKLLEAIK